jgi:hypothetical protein
MSFRKSSATYVTRCREFEFEHHLPQNPIGRVRTNENRLFRITTLSSQFHVESPNLDSDFSESHWLARNQLKSTFLESGFPQVIWSGEFESGHHLPWNSYWWTDNLWKSTCTRKFFSEVTSCGELESQVILYKNWMDSQETIEYEFHKEWCNLFWKISKLRFPMNILWKLCEWRC